MKQLISQGAEAKIYKEDKLIIKERTPKSYRLKILDERIRKARTKREINVLEKCSKIINVPKLNRKTSIKDFKIVMEFLNGKKLAEILDKFTENKRNRICKEIGIQTAIIHSNNIIHGDLTTSNMILKNNKVYFIDFGLSFIDPKPEHKAVDLHLLKQALESKHYKNFESSFKNVLKGYKLKSKEYQTILKRLEKVEGRGRYKQKNKK